MADKALCAIPDCDKQSVNFRGWCSTHYSRWLKHGDTRTRGTRYGEPHEFLDTVVQRRGERECLIWPYAKCQSGYGRVRIDGKTRAAHRIVCIRVHGDAPPDAPYAAHSCGNGHLGCVNPDHLRWATAIENAQDKKVHGTEGRGERASRAKLTDAQVVFIRKAYITSSITQQELADQFGVTRGTIGWIVLGKKWTHLL